MDSVNRKMAIDMLVNLSVPYCLLEIAYRLLTDKPFRCLQPGGRMGDSLYSSHPDPEQRSISRLMSESKSRASLYSTIVLWIRTDSLPPD